MGPVTLTLIITLAILAVAAGGYIFGAVPTGKRGIWGRVLLAIFLFFVGALTILYLLYLTGVFDL